MTSRPWETEPDELDFEADGLPCAMRRNGRWGTWCGYVSVGPEHPLFGLPTNHPLQLPASWFEGRKPLQGASPLDLFAHLFSGATSIEDACPISLALQVHGGVNYAADHVPGREPDGRWAFGFDCGHAGDYLPGGDNVNRMMDEVVDSMPAEVRGKMREIMRNTAARTGDYRDQSYVVSECQSLAAQLIAIVAVIAGETISSSDHQRDGSANELGINPRQPKE